MQKQHSMFTLTVFSFCLRWVLDICFLFLILEHFTDKLLNWHKQLV